MTAREATPEDADAIWEIFQEVIATGDTYVFDPGMSRREALAYWMQDGTRTRVAEVDGKVLGTYIFKANQPGLGSHVANASFMVSSAARGMGIGRFMGEDCLAEAARAGFRSMQFNIVVSTNRAALELWKSLGFGIVGTLPGAFRHSRLGHVDAHVMFRHLP